MESEISKKVRCEKTDECSGVYYPNSRKRKNPQMCLHHGDHDSMHGASLPRVACVKSGHCPLDKNDAWCSSVRRKEEGEMFWWNVVSNSVKVRDKLRTPGKGINGTGGKEFEIVAKSKTEITIKSGASKIKLPKDFFNAVEDFFKKNPSKKLRTSSRHDVPAYKNTVDEIVRGVSGKQTSCGHWVAAILEKCGLVKYTTVNGNRAIEPCKN